MSRSHPIKTLTMPNWDIICVSADATAVLLEDCSMKRGGPSLTNQAGQIVRELWYSEHRGRRIFYIDTLGRMDEILVQSGTFYDFKPGRKNEVLALFGEEILTFFQITN